eukprot:TRINITY_DN20196_c0_g1_i1.p1 TRINITY_DN20196_c0_g1~~TRINITY_DN20196_c0_g1_i1.p1  ORF type:complete len:512 (+),score=100.59 TRINITY_DN20196_c0_g1_i1:144-1679(+)
MTFLPQLWWPRLDVDVQRESKRLRLSPTDEELLAHNSTSEFEGRCGNAVMPQFGVTFDGTMELDDGEEARDLASLDEAVAVAERALLAMREATDGIACLGGSSWRQPLTMALRRLQLEDSGGSGLVAEALSKCYFGTAVLAAENGSDDAVAIAGGGRDGGSLEQIDAEDVERLHRVLHGLREDICRRIRLGPTECRRVPCSATIATTARGGNDDVTCPSRPVASLADVMYLTADPARWLRTVLGDSVYEQDFGSSRTRQEGNDDDMQCAADKLAAQPEVTAEIRCTIVDWIFEVQQKYTLKTETLFLAVSIFDRFLLMQTVRKPDVQLVMVTSAFIAAKFEEIDPPEVRKFVDVTSNACSRDAILRMEAAMLTALEFCLCRPTAAVFAERYHSASECDEEHWHLMQYTLELALLDGNSSRYPPSLQAAAAMVLSARLLRAESVRNCSFGAHASARSSSTVANCDSMTEALERCVMDFHALLLQAATRPQLTVRKKFMQPEHLGVASRDFSC